MYTPEKTSCAYNRKYPDVVFVIADLMGEAKLTKDSKPPLPKVHSTPKKPLPKAAEVRKPTDKLIRSARSSPRITPKATPLQSPGVEHVPLIRETNVEIIKQDESKETQDVKLEDKSEEKKDQGSEKTQVNSIPWYIRWNTYIQQLSSVSFKVNISLSQRFNIIIPFPTQQKMYI